MDFNTRLIPISVCAKRLRFMLNEHVKQGFRFDEIKGTITNVYRYRWKRFIALNLIHEELLKQGVEDDDEIQKFLDPCNHDTRYLLEAAALAWITIDDTRLSDLYPQVKEPEGLSYGLILKNYPAIYRAAFFISETTERDEYLSRPQVVLMDARDFALQETIHVLKGVPEDVIRKETVNMYPC